MDTHRIKLSLGHRIQNHTQQMPLVHKLQPPFRSQELGTVLSAYAAPPYEYLPATPPATRKVQFNNEETTN